MRTRTYERKLFVKKGERSSEGFLLPKSSENVRQQLLIERIVVLFCIQ